MGAVTFQKVLYKYVDSWGTDLPAEIIPIEMCAFHYNWLLEANTGKKMPEMAGEFVDEATECVLFAPFRAFRYAHNNTTWKLQAEQIKAEQQKQAEQHKQAEQQQAEQKQQAEQQKQKAEQAASAAKEDKLFEDFEECLYFIRSEIPGYYPAWTNDEYEDNNSEKNLELYKLFQELTEALLTDDVRTIRRWKLNGLLNNKRLLLITYVMANHELFSSTDKEKKRNMVNNVRLVELFIEAGLQNELLRLAISGERQRDLSIHRRDESNVLESNLFVVQFLVPKYIGAHEKAIVQCYSVADDEEPVTMTPLEYWHDFSNHMWYIGDCWMQNSGQGLSFEKDEDIRAYLEKMAIFEY